MVVVPEVGILAPVVGVVQTRLFGPTRLARLAVLRAVANAVLRWDRSAGVAVSKRFDVITKTMDWDLKRKFNHCSESVITQD